MKCIDLTSARWALLNSNDGTPQEGENVHVVFKNAPNFSPLEREARDILSLSVKDSKLLTNEVIFMCCH